MHRSYKDLAIDPVLETAPGEALLQLVADASSLGRLAHSSRRTFISLPVAGTVDGITFACQMENPTHGSDPWNEATATGMGKSGGRFPLNTAATWYRMDRFSDISKKGIHGGKPGKKSARRKPVGSRRVPC